MGEEQIPAAGGAPRAANGSTAEPGDPPCIVDLRRTGFRVSAVRERFRASRERGRRAWAAHPGVYRSYRLWSVLGALALAGTCALLAPGAGLSSSVLGVALSATWAALWIHVISFHLGLVQDDGRPARSTLGLPNVLTFLRVLLVPAVCWAILAHARWRPYASLVLAVIFLVGFSDVLDGTLARLLRWQTSFGRHLDHLADVLIMTGVAVAEHLAGMLPGWLMALVVVRYAGTGVGGVVSLMTVPGMQIAPTWIGKAATFVSGMTVFLALARVAGDWPLAAALPWLFRASGLLLAANIGILAVQVLRGGRPAR